MINSIDGRCAMANLFKNILDSLKLTEDDDGGDYDDYVSELEEKERKRTERMEQKQALKQDKKSFSTRSVNDDYQTKGASSSVNSASSFSEARKDRTSRMDKNMNSNSNNNVNKVVPIRNPQKSLEVCIMKPTSFEDSQDICDMLLSGRAAVINLEGFDVDVAQRVMDFVSGSVYAMNGKLHQISSYIFIISPDTVDISGDYLDLIRQNGFEVPTLSKEF
jgi:cell division inhibitor SepF